ncbi:uncharacterized protein C6orf47 homolog isoform 1-T2 [Synchiropus picturatus]
MTAVVGKAWGWVRSWGCSNSNSSFSSGNSEGVRGWTSWIWGGWKRQSDQSSYVEEYWEAHEKIQPVEIEEIHASQQEGEPATRWWNRYLPVHFFYWPRSIQTARKRVQVQKGGADMDGDFSDYGTPPPSPPPSSKISSPFRLFVDSCNMEILPEHYDICFNFLRHLFDLFVVGFLWTVSPPTKLILEVFGVQGTLRLWFHGMAMFFVSTVGMAGLLWLIQEYLPQFALIYGVMQAMVISVSMKQSVLFNVKEDKESPDDESKETNNKKDI